MEMTEFINYLESKDFSKSSQRSYIYYIDHFLAWYQKDATNCTKKDIINYLEYLQNTKKQSTKNRYTSLKALNHYFSYLKHNELIATDPTALIKLRGVNKKKLPHIYTPEELDQLNDIFYNYYITNFDESKTKPHCIQYSRLNRNRNYVMLGILIYQGIATHELQNIMLSDLDLNKAMITIRATKQGNERKIPLKSTQIGAIMNYINNIRPHFFDFCEPSEMLFLPLKAANQKEKTQTTSLLGTLKRFKNQVRFINKTFRKFTQLRSSTITHWIKTEGIRKAQYLAGHKYIRATEYYLTNDLQGLIEDIAKHHPFN